MQDYVLLGQTGLRVSRLAMGTMTFGEAAWGADAQTSHDLLDLYREAGGNFIDTADIYSGGQAEEIVGGYVSERKIRDAVVIATKYGIATAQGNPNGGGNGRKHMMAALEASLRRLKTDYVDLYYLHVWDRITPLEEVMRTFDDMVRTGKVRHVALSDTPAWYAAQAHTLAAMRGWEFPAAVQLEYSLLERNIEREHVDMARATGQGIVAWGPLAFGLLSGKYAAAGQGKFGEGRLQTLSERGGGAHPKLTPHNLAVAQQCAEIAAEIGRSLAQVSINWAATQPGVAAVILGATKVEQVRESLDALTFDLPEAARAKLNALTAPALCFPQTMFADAWQRRVHAGVGVTPDHAAYAPWIRIPPA